MRLPWALPDLQAQILTGALRQEDLAAAVTEAIENPTERMRKSYRQLDDEQRAVLVAMLDSERSPSIDDLERARTRFQVSRRPIQEAISLLKEGFLQGNQHIRGRVPRPKTAWIGFIRAIGILSSRSWSATPLLASISSEIAPG